MDIKLLVTDVDGTLTDGGMYYDVQGNEWKRFDTRDGMGISRLRAAGIAVMLLTGEDTPIVTRRAEKLQVEYCFLGTKDKEAFLAIFFEEHPAFSWETTAYIGDDVNDLPPIRRVAWSAAPADAQQPVLAAADYICKAEGGHGAVREFCERILAQGYEK